MGRGSRMKGKRGELDVAARVGGTRVGYLHQAKADVVTKFAGYQVKNTKPTWPTIVAELKALKGEDPNRNNYLVAKVDRKWYIIEELEQHAEDHGERPDPLEE